MFGHRPLSGVMKDVIPCIRKQRKGAQEIMRGHKTQKYANKKRAKNDRKTRDVVDVKKRGNWLENARKCRCTRKGKNVRNLAGKRAKMQMDAGKNKREMAWKRVQNRCKVRIYVWKKDIYILNFAVLGFRDFY